jgi:hypothetical protein
VHVLNWNAPLLALPPIARTVKTAQLLLTGSPVQFTQSSNGLVLHVPAAKKDEVDRVIVLGFDNQQNH